MKPLVSVLMPVYNGERFLRDAVDSVLGQSFKDFELLIIDDGSTDQSVRIASEYAAADRRVRLVEHPHVGLIRILNAGLDRCQGSWVARMDADDVCLPDRLEAQLAFAEAHRNVVLIGTYAKYIGESGRVVGSCRLGPTTEQELREMASRGRMVHFIHPTVMMRRTIIGSAGGYDPRFELAEDLELYNRLIERGYLCLALPKAKLLYRVHGKSSVMSSNREMFGRVRFVQAVLSARREGMREPTYAEFVAAQRGRPWLKRVHERRGDLGGVFYRRAAVEVGRGRPGRGAMWLAGACALGPSYVWSKLRSQVFRLGRREEGV